MVSRERTRKDANPLRKTDKLQGVCLSINGVPATVLVHVGWVNPLLYYIELKHESSSLRRYSAGFASMLFGS